MILVYPGGILVQSPWKSSGLQLPVAHGQVDKREDVVFDHDGKAEEDGIQSKHVHAQLKVQPPLVHMDPQHLKVENQN